MNKRRPPQPRKRPRQSRSLMTMRAIQEACLIILRREGPDGLTTQHIAETAGVNIASVYQYFPNKDAIVADIFEATVNQLTELAAHHFRRIHELSSRSPESTLAAIIDLECAQLLELHKLEPDFFRAYWEWFDVHSRVDDLTQSHNNPAWQAWLEERLARWSCAGDPALRGLMVSQTIQGNIQMALRHEPSLLAQTAFRRELLQVVLRYLEIDS